MWFGESEKIIKKIFTNYRKLCQEAERHKENTPILLFNEADALISKRKDVTSGNCAQTENAIQNILLEEIEKLPLEERQRRNRIYDHYAPEDR